VYFDTPKSKLQKYGLTLRVRSVGERRIQTIKAGVSGAGMFDRSEWESEIDRDEPDLNLAAGTPVADLLAGRRSRLRPVFKTVVDRTTWLIETDQSEIEVALDQGQVVAQGNEQPIAELELELKRGLPDDLFAVARSLDRKSALRIGVLTKSERGYSLVGDQAPGSFKAGPVPVQPGIGTAKAFQALGALAFGKRLSS
jgi:inorganic triphosphatase YgiF